MKLSKMQAIVCACFLICVCLLVYVIVLNKQVNDIQHKLTSQNSIIASQTNRITGEHRDLITCGDLQSLITNNDIAYWTVDSNYGSLIATSATLPSHCINP